MPNMQDAIRALTDFWSAQNCLVVQPFNTEVGAGTMNPATILRVLGPEPWRAAYVEPSVRPDDSRYGENPNRLQTHTQYQVVLKPEPGNPQELLLASLEALGIDLRSHDVRFIEDNWAQPAIGAWGLGWEVWLDGMEITQFTYFQQVGGVNLDPVAVEITYGLERILMASQGVTHFRDIEYAPGITYGEVYGQSEYEMSRYYLDDADIDANRLLFDTFTTEAQLMLDRSLPVPAHTYVLKSSHAFNVLDARGAIGTTERANAFALMRRLSRDVSRLWVERREELGFPLSKTDQAGALAPAPAPVPMPLPERSESPKDLLIEIGFEELPPEVVPQTVESVERDVRAALAGALDHGEVRAFATPRRVAVLIDSVAAWGEDLERTIKGPKWAASFDDDGTPTRALDGFLRSKGATADQVVRVTEGSADHAAVEVTEPGRDVGTVVSQMVADVVRGLRSDRNMRWSDPELSFSRPIRWIVALWGAVEVPVACSELTSGRQTRLHRSASPSEVDLADAESYLTAMRQAGIVLSRDERRDRIVTGATELAASCGGYVDVESEGHLLDEITELVEEPVPLMGDFDERYLDLPEQVLTVVMRKHQRYLPVRGEGGQLLPHFITVANGPCDHEVVRSGNESVLRARYEDAAFFFEADLATPPEEFHRRLERLTFDERLGSVLERAERIRDVASHLAIEVPAASGDAATLQRAGRLAKFDLATQMVVEFSSLAGFMAREYAIRAGEPPEVADALAEMERPLTAADQVPASVPGALLAVADRADLLVAMFAVGAKVTGSSDPFGLRRAALGIARILRDAPPIGRLGVEDVLRAAAARLRQQGVEVSDQSVTDASAFCISRFDQLLREENAQSVLVDAVRPSAGTPRRAAAYLEELERLVDDDSFQLLVGALERVGRILPDGTVPLLDADLLVEPAETALMAAISALPSRPEVRLTDLAALGAVIGDAVDDFFDQVLVNDPDERIRTARLGLLSSLRAAVPDGIDWGSLYLSGRQRLGVSS